MCNIVYTQNTHYYYTHGIPTLCMYACIQGMGFSNSNVCVHLTVSMYVNMYVRTSAVEKLL